MNTHLAFPPRSLSFPFPLGLLLTALLAMGGLPTPGARAQTPPPEDVLLMVDAEGRLGSDAFQGELDFLQYLDDNMPGRTSSRVGLIEWSTTPTTKYNFTDSQNTATIDTTLHGLNYIAASAFVKDAVQAGINLFTAQSPPANPKLLILFTDNDANPVDTQNPASLAATLAADHIPVIVVGEGQASGPPDPAYYAPITSNGGAYYSIPNPGNVVNPVTTANAAADAAQFLSAESSYFGLPEPGSLTLLLVGGAAAAARRWRKKASR